MKNKISIKGLFTTFIKVFTIMLVSNFVSITYLFFSQDAYYSENLIIAIDLIIFSLIQFLLPFLLKFKNKLELLIVLIFTSAPIFMLSVYNLSLGNIFGGYKFSVKIFEMLFLSQSYYSDAIRSNCAIESNVILIIIVAVLVAVFSQGLIFFGNEAGIKCRRKHIHGNTGDGSSS